MTMPMEAAYRTKDLPEASALYAAGINFIGLTPTSDGRSLYFLFDSEHAADISRRFWTGWLQVSARTYASAIKFLKGAVSARKHGYEHEYEPTRRSE